MTIAPLDKGSKLEEIVTKIRVRKGIKVGKLLYNGYDIC
jgi:hypothetical protein